MTRNGAIFGGIIAAAVIIAITAGFCVYMVVVVPRTQAQTDMILAEHSFNQCKADIDATYLASWKSSCIAQAPALAAMGHSDSSCSLPLSVSDELDRARQRGLDECMREAKAGF